MVSSVHYLGLLNILDVFQLVDFKSVIIKFCIKAFGYFGGDSGHTKHFAIRVASNMEFTNERFKFIGIVLWTLLRNHLVFKKVNKSLK